MSKKSTVPDAWDDDWEAAADISEAKAAQPEAAPKLSKAQRRAQHLEQQKQIWDSAENPDRFHWLDAHSAVPLKQEFKQQVKVLSRKPIAPTIAQKDVSEGVKSLNMDDGEDSEEEERKKREADLEERQRKAKIEREEKQKKYAEARERIMGSASPAPAAPTSRDSSHGRDYRKSRARVNGNRSSQTTSSADQSPQRLANHGEKQLFDPDDMGRRLPKRETVTTPIEDQPSRQPRNPEAGERGGFGFAARGGRSVS